MNEPDILDLIDGAIDDYDTSVDAMRWTSTPPETAAPAVLPIDFAIHVRIDEFRRGWQQLVAAMRPIIESWGKAFQHLAEHLAPLIDRRASIAAEARRARLRSMHAAYRRKTRGRRGGAR